MLFLFEAIAESLGEVLCVKLDLGPAEGDFLDCTTAHRCVVVFACLANLIKDAQIASRALTR